jgi:hypothetical protein
MQPPTIRIGDKSVVYSGTLISNQGDEIEIRPFLGDEFRIVLSFADDPEKTDATVSIQNDSEKVSHWILKNFWSSLPAATAAPVKFGEHDGRVLYLLLATNITGSKEKHTRILHYSILLGEKA